MDQPRLDFIQNKMVELLGCTVPWMSHFKRSVQCTSQVPQPTCFWTSQSQAGTLTSNWRPFRPLNFVFNDLRSPSRDTDVNEL